MAQAPLLPGWRRVPGTSRQYINVATGQKVSRRQYDKFATAAGVRQPLDIAEKAKRRVKQARYQDLVEDFVAQKKSQGIKITKRQARSSKELKGLLGDLKKASKPAPKKLSGEKLLDYRRKQNRKKLNLLKKLGRRDGLPDWLPVGFSDRFRTGKIVKRSDLPKEWRL